MTTFALDEELAEMGSTGRPLSEGRASASSAESEQPSPCADKLNPDEFMLNECRYREDSFSHPLGWPRLAAMQDQFSNMAMFRDFSYPRWRLILYRGARLAFLSSELRKFDKKGGEHLEGLTKNQTRPAGHPPIRSDFDDLMAAINEADEEYSAVCARAQDMLRLHPVPREQYRDLLEHMAEMGMLNKEGYVWMNSPDEFRSMSAPPSPWVIRFLYSRLGKWIIKKISPKGNDPHSRSLPEDALIVMLKTLQLMGAAGLLLTPVGIMLLNELTGPQAFGVVVGSAIVFSAVVTATHEVDTHKTLVGVCAYMAIMAAFAVARGNN